MRQVEHWTWCCTLCSHSKSLWSHRQGQHPGGQQLVQPGGIGAGLAAITATYGSLLFSPKGSQSSPLLLHWTTLTMADSVSGATCRRSRQPMHRMAGWTRCAYNACLSPHNCDSCAATATACSSNSASARPSDSCGDSACQSRAATSGKPSPSSR